LFKCSFAQPTIEYLGLIVSEQGVGPNPSKVEAMLVLPSPTNVKQFCGFLGLTGFYRKFAKHYAFIAAALTKLLKNDSFSWTNIA